MRTLSPNDSEELDGLTTLRPVSAHAGANSYLLLGQAPHPRRRWRGILWKASMPFAVCTLVVLSAISLGLLPRRGLGGGGGAASAGAPGATSAAAARLGRGPAAAVTRQDEEKKSDLPKDPWRCIPDGSGGWRCRLPAKAGHKEQHRHFKKQDLDRGDWSPEFKRHEKVHGRHEQHSEKSAHDETRGKGVHRKPEGHHHQKSSKNAEHEHQKSRTHHEEGESHVHHEEKKSHPHHEDEKTTKSKKQAHEDEQKKHAHHEGKEDKERAHRAEQEHEKKHAHQVEHKKDLSHHEARDKENSQHEEQDEEEGEEENKEGHAHDEERSDKVPETWMGHHALGDAGEDDEQVVSDGQPSRSPWQAALSSAAGAFGGIVSGAKAVLHLPTETSTSTDTTTVKMKGGTTITTTDTTTSMVTSTGTSTSTSTSTRTTTSTTTVTTTVMSTSTTSSKRLATLFCFEVMRISGFEPGLVRGQWKNNASIFACEEYSLFSHGGVVQVGSITTSEITAAEITKGNLKQAGTTTDSWLNTRLFQEAWNHVLAEDKWWNHAWTVKVDPDAVFFPHRLRRKLFPFYPAGIKDGPALFVGNCDRSWGGEPTTLKLFGALEVFSRNAMGVYKAWGHRCIKELNWKGWGEDFFMQRCLKMLQVKMLDGVDFVGDNRCHGAPCRDTSKVAFHAYKDIQRYFDCWGESRAAEGLVKTP